MLYTMGKSEDHEFEFEVVCRNDGKTEILRTDDEGEFLRFNLERHILDSKTGAKIKIELLEDRWFRIEVTFQPGDSESNMDLYQDLDAAFTGKGWYEHKKSGGNDDGSVLWFVVRYQRGCPVI